MYSCSVPGGLKPSLQLINYYYYKRARQAAADEAHKEDDDLPLAQLARVIATRREFANINIDDLIENDYHITTNEILDDETWEADMLTNYLAQMNEEGVLDEEDTHSPIESTETYASVKYMLDKIDSFVSDKQPILFSIISKFRDALIDSENSVQLKQATLLDYFKSK